MAFDPETIDSSIPRAPGVYLMKAVDGEIIYVGKAANLRNRVRQYFGATSDTRYFIHLLGDLLETIDVLITSNEKEALILENDLIKQHQPRFNVELKDDKSFLHLRIDERVDWPRLEIVRRPKRDGAKYFGPYHSASKIRQMVKVIERYFNLRTCDDLSFRNRSRPCLQYQIKRCPGPCVLPVNQEEYADQVEQVILFLKGRRDELARSLKEKMGRASELMDYEKAARFRDQLIAVNDSLESQGVVDLRELDRDIFGLYREGSLLQITILQMRRGRMVGSQGFDFNRQGVPTEEVISTVANLFYSGGQPIPDEILMPVEPDAFDALEDLLTDLRHKRVRIKLPQRGSNRRLLELATKNAEHAFFQAREDEARRDGGLARLKKKLGLSNMPHRIECFDISLFQGSSAVGSKVAFLGGVPARAGYRRYTIKETDGTDDYAMMREVLLRRLERGLKEEDLPDLLVVDGGKGQLNVAQAVLQDLDITGVDVVALAKSRVLDGLSDGEDGVVRSSERVFVPGVRDAIKLRPHTDELFLMTRLRDEAHRFAITFHRKKRHGKHFQSALAAIPGVGHTRQRALLRNFGSLKRIREADVDSISAVKGIGRTLAESIYAYFRS
jgi:excinuclease ABC subunit C